MIQVFVTPNGLQCSQDDQKGCTLTAETQKFKSGVIMQNFMFFMKLFFRSCSTVSALEAVTFASGVRKLLIQLCDSHF